MAYAHCRGSGRRPDAHWTALLRNSTVFQFRAAARRATLLCLFPVAPAAPPPAAAAAALPFFPPQPSAVDSQPPVRHSNASRFPLPPAGGMRRGTGLAAARVPRLVWEGGRMGGKGCCGQGLFVLFEMQP